MLDLAQSPFRPHRLLQGGHLQTLAGIAFPGPRAAYRAVRHTVTLDDGDQIVLHDDCPAGWQAGQRAALMIHGLAGSHLSPYMVRIAQRLNERGLRTFRMDLRGCGAGLKLARRPYHSGRSEDAAAALAQLAKICPGSAVTLIGFSLGGNIALKLLGESAGSLPENLERGVAVCPPVDLAACVRAIGKLSNRAYDRYFARLLYDGLQSRRQIVPDLAMVEFARRPRGLWEFDNLYTGPVCGFGDAANYYARCSSLPLLARIGVPTLIVAAHDDPLIPPQPLLGAALSASTELHMAPSGGHLGFLGRGSQDPDRHWLDWRVVQWVCGDSA